MDKNLGPYFTEEACTPLMNSGPSIHCEGSAEIEWVHQEAENVKYHRPSVSNVGATSWVQH